MIHTDKRRTLEDWPEAKIITANEDCHIGGHYHKLKTEKFILTNGSGSLSIDRGYYQNIAIGELITIYPFEYHSFKLTKGSVLIGICSNQYDPTDDYKL